jgi:hypothetical protein
MHGPARERELNPLLTGKSGSAKTCCTLTRLRAPSSELVRAAKAGHRVWHQQSELPTRIYAL